MANWSIGAVGGNPHIAGHYGAALKMATELGLPHDHIAHMVNEYKDLSSTFPAVAGLLAGLSGGVSEAHARGNETVRGMNLSVESFRS